MPKTQRFQDLDYYVTEGEIISGDRFKAFCDLQPSLKYQKRDFLFKSGVWRGTTVKSILSNPEEYKGKTLVVGHSDYALGVSRLGILKRLGIKKVFGVNTQPWCEFSESLPLGVTNSTDETPIHKLLGDNSHFLKANGTGFPEFTGPNTVYVNFTRSNNVRTRAGLIDLLPSLRKDYEIIVKTPEFSNAGRINYLQDLRKNALVLCPEGNGVDTHRFWETIYMGGTPVVTLNSKMKSFYTQLPVIILDNWLQLRDKEIIESKWEEVNCKTYDFSYLRGSRWNTNFLKSES